MMRPSLSLLLAFSMLTACDLAPDFAHPASPVAEQWAGIAQPEATTESAAELPWRSYFQSPQLQGYIQQALEHNRDLRIAALNVEKAQAAYRIQRSDLFPKIGAQGQWSRTATPENANQFGGSFSGGRFTQSSYQANLAVTAWELDLFGRVRNLNEAALEDFFATQQARNGAQISLIAETANAYLQWLADEKALKLAGDTLGAQEKSFGLIEKSYQGGVRSKLELEQARSTMEEARAAHASYARFVAQDKNALALLTGAPSADSFTTPETLDDVKILGTLPVGMPAQVLLHRPDIQQAEHALKAENANIGAARAAFFPSITLTGSFGFSSVELSNLFSSGSGRAWNFAPQAKLPLFAGGENFANLDSAKVSKQIAVAEYEKAIQTAFREVSDELAARETLTTQLTAQVALVKANQSAYDLSFARYKAGTDNYLTALESQRALFGAQQNAIDVQRQQLANLVNLYKVLGGGLVDAAPETTNE